MDRIAQCLEHRRCKKILNEYYKLIKLEKYEEALKLISNNINSFTNKKHIDHFNLCISQVYKFLDEYDLMCEVSEKITINMNCVFARYHQFLYLWDMNHPKLDEFYQEFIYMAQKEKNIFTFLIKETKELMEFKKNNKPVSKGIIKHFMRFKAPVAGRILKKITNLNS